MWLDDVSGVIADNAKFPSNNSLDKKIALNVESILITGSEPLLPGPYNIDTEE